MTFFLLVKNIRGPYFLGFQLRQIYYFYPFDTVVTRPETFIRDPGFDLDPIQKPGYPKWLNLDPDSKMLDPSKPNSDSDILIF